MMDERLKDFTAALASSAPAPGGGGAAAVMGALAASLGAMAASLSAGRKSAAAPEALRALAAECEGLRLRFLEQIAADEAAFLPLAAAYRLPKDAPGRANTLRLASTGACSAAAELLRLALACTDALEALRALVSPLLLSDLGCAAASCRALLLSAAFNVYVNVRPYPEDAAAQALHREADAALAAALPRLEALERSVLETLGGAL